MSRDDLIYSKQSGIAILEINRPDSENRIDSRIALGMRDIISDISLDNDIRVMVLTARGKVFCSGDDVSMFNTPVEFSRDNISDYFRASMIARPLASLQIPTICALNGDAFGHGLELALACDIRIATEGMKLGFPDIVKGIMPWDGGTQRLPRTIGLAWATDLLLTGRVVSSEESVAIGLVHTIVPSANLADYAKSIATGMSDMAPIATRYIKEAIYKGIDLTLDQGMRLEADLNMILQSTNDREEGIQSFLQRRSPSFQGD
mgnify:CR=1 FL=1